MKKLIFTFALALIGFIGYAQQASMIIPTQALNPKTYTPPNYLFVDSATLRVWPVRARDVRLEAVNIQWLNDSIIVIADRRYVKLAGSYPNPTFISSLSSSKVTGLSTVATSGDYNDLLNKPNLSVYETSSHAASTYQPIGSYYPLTGNPSNFLTSFTEVDPIWSGVSANYRTKTQNDALYKAIGYVPSNADIVSGLGYTPVTNARTLTINGTAFDLSANRSWTVGDVTSASLSSTLSGYATTSALTSGLATKEPTITAGTTSQYWRGDKTWQTLDKSAVGLSNVDNTSDANKPLSIATTTALNGKQNTLSLTTTGSGTATLVGSTLNIPTPTPTVYTAGTGISIASNVITNTAPDYIPTPVSATRSLNSNFTISATKQSLVNYSVSLSVTNPLLVGNSSAAAYLEYSINAGSTWVSVSDGLISSSVGVTVTVAITNTQTQILSGTIPANALVRIRTATSGTASVVYVRGQETY